MLSSLSLLLVTWSLFQAPSQRASNDFRPDAPGQPHASTDTAITPELRGDVYMARKQYEKAIESYKEASSSSAVILNKTGIAYQQWQKPGQARHYYQLALKTEPHYAEAINNLGTIYYGEKSYRRAANEYQKALKYEPKSASIISNLGTAYFARKKYKEASIEYQQALALDPDVFEHQNTAGVLLQDRSVVEERAKFHYYLAKTYAKAGMTDRALQSIRQSLEEGFKDRKKYSEDPEFAALQNNAEFKRIMATEQKVL